MSDFGHRAQPPPEIRVPGKKYAHLPHKEAVKCVLREIQIRIGLHVLAVSKVKVMRFNQ